MTRQAIPNFAVCALLCLPTLALCGDEQQSLRQDLSRTVNELATFKDIQDQLAAGNPQAVADLLAVCAVGPTDAAAAETELANLRTRINALQEILDARTVWSGEVAIAPDVIEPSAAVVPVAVIAAATGAVSAVNAAAGTKTAFEAQDFVADRARLGRACWRGGRFLEGVAALEPLAGEPKADYWRARCLEKLARNAEALELYKKVIEIAGESPEGRCAREDHEFLEWSIGHGLVKAP